MTSRQPYETALVGEIICSHRCDPWKQEALLCLPSLCLLMQTTCRGRGRLGAHHSSVDSPPPAPPKTFHSVLSPCITNTGRTHRCGVCVCVIQGSEVKVVSLFSSRYTFWMTSPEARGCLSPRKH